VQSRKVNEDSDQRPIRAQALVVASFKGGPKAGLRIFSSQFTIKDEKIPKIHCHVFRRPNGWALLDAFQLKRKVRGHCLARFTHARPRSPLRVEERGIHIAKCSNWRDSILQPHTATTGVLSA
jgi:hypothetical protein